MVVERAVSQIAHVSNAERGMIALIIGPERLSGIAHVSFPAGWTIGSRRARGYPDRGRD